jgi:hypothetical protein
MYRRVDVSNIKSFWRVLRNRKPLDPCVAPRRLGGLLRHCRSPPPWSPFHPSLASSRWQRDRVSPFSRSSHNRVLFGLGFTRRRCSAAELGFAGGAWFLCVLVFLAALEMRKRWRCRGIISPSFFRSPMAIYFDVNEEAEETCLGVEGRRIVFFRWWCCWSC